MAIVLYEKLIGVRILVEKRNKVRLILYGSVFLGIALGVYAQDIAYFLHSNLGIPLLVGISLITVISILFFLIPPMLVSKVNKQNKVWKKEVNIYLGINVLIGIVISAFSLIVLIAWWG